MGGEHWVTVRSRVGGIHLPPSRGSSQGQAAVSVSRTQGTEEGFCALLMKPDTPWGQATPQVYLGLFVKIHLFISQICFEHLHCIRVCEFNGETKRSH